MKKTNPKKPQQNQPAKLYSYQSMKRPKPTQSGGHQVPDAPLCLPCPVTPPGVAAGVGRYTSDAEPPATLPCYVVFGNVM